MKKYNLFLLYSFIIAWLYVTSMHSQTTPMPSTPAGTTTISYNASEQKYYFNYNGVAIYSYFVGNGEYWYNNGATFHGLKAKATNGIWFWPSNAGGLTAFLSNQEKVPWDAGVTYSRLNHSLSNNIVTAEWRMLYNGDYIDYSFKFQISNKSLIIAIEVKNGSTKATGINFDRSENSHNKIIVHIPYLTLFNILYSDNSYTSLFVDWEFTNASQIYPLDPGEYNVPEWVSQNSIKYTQRVLYKKKTNGIRNTLNEKIYLTVSSNIDEVLPNLPGPTATLREQAAERTVLAYGPPYPWLLWSNPDYDYLYLDSIKSRGVNNLNVIIKQYQYYGFDRKLPDVLLNGVEPATFDSFGCVNAPGGGQGSRQHLIDVRNHLVNDLGYGFALHEQYVDYYKNAPSYLSTQEAKRSPDDGSGAVLNWVNCEPETAHIIKPFYAPEIANLWSSQLNDFNPTWSYLDVHSAANPSDFVDYESNFTGTGSFKYVLNQYRSIPAILKSNYGINVPIQGEGGKGLMLYAGYFDDLEARLLTANYNVYGFRAPLFVDFAIKKIKPKSALHGVGHCRIFFQDCIEAGCENEHVYLNTEELLTYISTEIAYGNSGLITKGNVIDHTIEQAILEDSLVLPVAQALINASPISIQYGNSLQTASQYIISHPGYADINIPTDFMGKVKVTYDNGVIVYVNRHPSETWNVTVGAPNKWFSYHAIVNGLEQLYAGQSSNTSFVLPAKNGWVVYNPGYSTTINGLSEIDHPAKGQSQITCTWTASTVQGQPPYTYKWYWDNVLVSSNSSYSITLKYDGWYNPKTHRFRVEVLDSSTPKLSTSTTMFITEYCGGYRILAKENIELLPKEFALQQNYPNPFNPITIIKYALPENVRTQIKVYDILGKEVAELINEEKSAGWYEVEFNASSLASGIYFYRIKAGSFVETKKMILIK